MFRPADGFVHPLPPQPRPDRFTFPFHYVPHPVARAAAAELRTYLEGTPDFDHDFGHGPDAGIGSRGKMFGVLVVEKEGGELGYLAGFSGKVADGNHWPGFVPPVFDILEDDGFYRTGEKEVHALTLRIEALAGAPELAAARAELSDTTERVAREIAAEKKSVRAAKRERHAQRERATADGLPELEERLARESVGRHFGLKDLIRAGEAQVAAATTRLAALEDALEDLREERRTMSHDLQHRIFAHYAFLDADGRTRDLNDIFSQTIFKIPPAGAGECAAPKLLQYAYSLHLRPVALAEFWWGQSPKSEIRRHGSFYPACRGKCEPILGHMLRGLAVDPNPLLNNPAAGKTIGYVYEDDHLAVIDKPAEFLSVPGRTIEDSVYLRVRKKYPSATGPLIVHRLDMSTSGLLLITRTKAVHKLLQQQFFKRSVKKRYLALLDGTVSGEAGFIDLPLRGDLEDRPRQIVCHDHGKTARTRWRVIERHEGRTLVHLWPVTGRTHQLRVHCAHPLGLNTPILGDDLYGQPGDRLHLHAAWIEFVHPVSKETVSFESAPPF